MAHTWQLQEAKSKLSAVIGEAQSHGPQVITQRGVQTAILLSYSDYKILLGEREGLATFFRNSPLVDVDLDISRTDGPARDFDLS